MGKLGPYELNSIVTGDARELAKAIPDESVDLILTDPPFGINFKYNNGYKDNPADYENLMIWLITECNRIIKPGGLSFVYVAQPKLRHVFLLFPENSRIFAACKNFVQMKPVIVKYAYDPIIFWVKKGNKLKDYQGRDWHIGNTANTNNRGLNEVSFHSCPRPLDTIIYLISNFCPPNGIVLDFFAGSGTTNIAANITGRKHLSFELFPQTAELARQRVANTQPPLPIQWPEQLALIEK